MGVTGHTTHSFGPLVSEQCVTLSSHFTDEETEGPGDPDNLPKPGNSSHRLRPELWLLPALRLGGLCCGSELCWPRRPCGHGPAGRGSREALHSLGPTCWLVRQTPDRQLGKAPGGQTGLWSWARVPVPPWPHQADATPASWAASWLQRRILAGPAGPERTALATQAEWPPWSPPPMPCSPRPDVGLLLCNGHPRLAMCATCESPPQP